RAFSLTRISSSSFSWIACVSRVCVFWITKTMRKVTNVVPGVMTSCQVSDQPKIGREAAHRSTTAIASTDVEERPTSRSPQPANPRKHGFGLSLSMGGARSEFERHLITITLLTLPQTRSSEIGFLFLFARFCVLARATSCAFHRPQGRCVFELVDRFGDAPQF